MTTWSVSGDPSIDDHSDAQRQGSIAWCHAQAAVGDTLECPVEAQLKTKGEVRISKAVFVEGRGSELLYTETAGIRIVHVAGPTGTTLEGAAIRDLSVTGSDKAHSLGIRVASSKNIVVERVKISDVFNGLGGVNSEGLTLKDIDVFDYSSFGIVPESCVGVHAENIDIRGGVAEPGGSAFQFKKCSQSSLSHAVIVGASEHGVNVRSANGYACSDISVFDVKVRDVPKHGFYVHVDDELSTVSGVSLEEVEAVGCGWWGVTINGEGRFATGEARLSDIEISKACVDCQFGAGSGMHAVCSVDRVSIGEVLIVRATNGAFQLLDVIDWTETGPVVLVDCAPAFETDSPLNLTQIVSVRSRV